MEVPCMIGSEFAFCDSCTQSATRIDFEELIMNIICYYIHEPSVSQGNWLRFRGLQDKPGHRGV